MKEVFYQFADLFTSMLVFLVSLLTLYSAAILRKGILAVSMLSFGVGMLLISIGFLLRAVPDWNSLEQTVLIYDLAFITGFLLLGFGSYKIFTMSRIK